MIKDLIKRYSTRENAPKQTLSKDPVELSTIRLTKVASSNPREIPQNRR